MHCPFCEADDTKVIDSRLVAEGDSVRRRRECQACGERFTTFETAELVMPRIVKRDGSREPFNEDKLLRGFQKALEKRPVPVEDVDSAMNRIKHRLRSDRRARVALHPKLGEEVMDELKQPGRRRLRAFCICLQRLPGRQRVSGGDSSSSPERHRWPVTAIELFLRASRCSLASNAACTPQLRTRAWVA